MSDIIKSRAKDLTAAAISPAEVSRLLVRFVQNDIIYYLDEWEVGPEEALGKGYGMCAGKALLAAELHRAMDIPARFRVVKVLGEEGLFDFITRRLEEGAEIDLPEDARERALRALDSLPRQRDHIIVQVFLNGKWVDLDVARDKGLEYGMKVLGIWRPLQIVAEEGPYYSLAGWLEDRMHRRTVREDRRGFFGTVNQQIGRIRHAGLVAEKGGVRAWTDADTREAIRSWDAIPGFPIGPLIIDNLGEAARIAASTLRNTEDPAQKADLEEKLVDWLYALVRYNIKRGPFWNLADVCRERRADCLGYAQLFTFLMREFGLEGGVIEALQDSSGSYVPHQVCLVRLTDGRKRLVDGWYGSADMRHQLVTVRVRTDSRLKSRDLTFEELELTSEVFSLAPEHVAGVSFYILGNAYLERGMNADAVDCFDVAAWLYPRNVRALFNRAVALESMGEKDRAAEDYSRAFADESGLTRLLASVENAAALIELDEKGISEPDQRIYLLREGFISGQTEEWVSIAALCGVTVADARASYDLVIANLGTVVSPD